MTRRKKPAAARICKDCIAEFGPGAKYARRPAPNPGPRCASHHRAIRKQRSDARWAVYLWKTYHITVQQYYALLGLQGGVCYICARANGSTRRLSVDHDHACCNGPISCGNCVRGLLCRHCNRDVLGHLRDDPAAFKRGWEYIENPPAQRLKEEGKWLIPK
jgi:hypothetical protein